MLFLASMPKRKASSGAIWCISVVNIIPVKWRRAQVGVTDLIKVGCVCVFWAFTLAYCGGMSCNILLLQISSKLFNSIEVS